MSRDDFGADGCEEPVLVTSISTVDTQTAPLRVRLHHLDIEPSPVDVHVVRGDEPAAPQSSTPSAGQAVETSTPTKQE